MYKPQLELVKENKSAKRGRLKALPISRLFPNIVTLMALCAGMSSIRFALNEKWEMSITFIVIAALLDWMDGRLARMLKATSEFGAQLDSLADFLNFGIAPPLVLYLWSLNSINIKGVGWAITLFYTVCCAIRLARFNTSLLEEERPLWADKFFIGIPSPAGASLAVTPMMINFQYGYNINPLLLGCYLSVIALMMASRVPTFSSKKITIRHEYISLVLVLAGLLITSMIIEPWITLPLLAIIYALSIPISVLVYIKTKNSDNVKPSND